MAAPKEQGYSGAGPNWDVIAEVAAAVRVPVIGNGDIAELLLDVAMGERCSGVRGLMIGRAAMNNPWIFREIKHYLATGEMLAAPTLEGQWAFIIRHCRWKAEAEGSELHAMQAMRTRSMAYSRRAPEAKHLRFRFAHVAPARGVGRHRRGDPRAPSRRQCGRVSEYSYGGNA